MPITISYDLKQATPNDHNRIRSALETFGWEGLGGSTAVCADLSHFVFATSAWLISLKYLLAR
jgi:hypothetical protein